MNILEEKFYQEKMDKVYEELSNMSNEEIYENFDNYQIGKEGQVTFDGSIDGELVEINIDIDVDDIVWYANEIVDYYYHLENPEYIEDEYEAEEMDKKLRDFYKSDKENIDKFLFLHQVYEIVDNRLFEIVYDGDELL